MIELSHGIKMFPMVRLPRTSILPFIFRPLWIIQSKLSSVKHRNIQFSCPLHISGRFVSRMQKRVHSIDTKYIHNIGAIEQQRNYQKGQAFSLSFFWHLFVEDFSSNIEVLGVAWRDYFPDPELQYANIAWNFWTAAFESFHVRIPFWRHATIFHRNVPKIGPEKSTKLSPETVFVVSVFCCSSDMLGWNIVNL